MVDPRREHSLINKHVRRRNREVGELLTWFEWAGSTNDSLYYDDIYDEGAPGSGGRTYHKGVIVPTIYIEEVEDAFRAIDTGRQPTQNISVVMLAKDMEDSGVTNPRQYESHLNDLFQYDSKTYKVRTYRARGRLNYENPSGEVLVAVQGFEVYPDQEMIWSLSPHNPHSDLPWPTSFPS
jgi:hypothetical protein